MGIGAKAIRTGGRGMIDPLKIPCAYCRLLPVRRMSDFYPIHCIECDLSMDEDKWITGGINAMAGKMEESQEILKDFDDKEYRDAFVRANVFSWLAFQIRELREQRGVTQTDLASLLGTRQSVVSRLERSGEKGLSLKTLLDVAQALDVAILVKFVPFSRFLREYEDVSPEAMKIKEW